MPVVLRVGVPAGMPARQKEALQIAANTAMKIIGDAGASDPPDPVKCKTLPFLLGAREILEVAREEGASVVEISGNISLDVLAELTRSTKKVVLIQAVKGYRGQFRRYERVLRCRPETTPLT